MDRQHTLNPFFSVWFSFLLFRAAHLQAQRHFREQLVGFRASDEFDIDASAFDLFNRVLDAFESRHGDVLVNRANVRLAVAALRPDTTLPFDELRRRSLINKDAQGAGGAPEPEFSQRIRASLPTIAR
jgi:hypothetical protein